jgi:PEGA domain
MRIAIVIALAALCGGCATVTRGMTSQVQIQSDPPGAEARTSMGHVCSTPCTLQFNRKDEFVVTITKPGFHTEEIPVVTRVAGAGAAGFAGNVILGGVVGMAADAASGATLEHFPNPVIATLEPVRKGQQPRVIRREPPPPPTPPVASTDAGPRS